MRSDRRARTGPQKVQIKRMRVGSAGVAALGAALHHVAQGRGRSRPLPSANRRRLLHRRRGRAQAPALLGRDRFPQLAAPFSGGNEPPRQTRARAVFFREQGVHGRIRFGAAQVRGRGARFVWPRRACAARTGRLGRRLRVRRANSTVNAAGKRLGGVIYLSSCRFEVKLSPGVALLRNKRMPLARRTAARLAPGVARLPPRLLYRICRIARVGTQILRRAPCSPDAAPGQSSRRQWRLFSARYRVESRPTGRESQRIGAPAERHMAERHRKYFTPPASLSATSRPFAVLALPLSQRLFSLCWAQFQSVTGLKRCAGRAYV